MKAIKGSEVRAGMKLQTEDGQIITVTKVIKPVKDRLYNRAGGWDSAIKIEWKGGGWAIIDDNDELEVPA